MTAVTANIPRVVDSVPALREAVLAARHAGNTIGLVPTMGALHEGHLSLVRASRAECGFTVVTIFVNPTQFGPHEDLDKYPRTLEADLQLLGECGADLVFAPPSDAMYPAGFSTYVQPPQAAEPLEGVCRPGHFRGVATIVLKLFHQAQADVAFFGQKDFQQALVIQRMVQDLDVPVAIRVCPIVREPDGLAMSSRNRYLSDAERCQSLALSRALRQATRLVGQGERDVTVILDAMRRTLTDAGVDRIEYVALCDPENLRALDSVDRTAVALIAAFVGNTRLIDNCRIEPERAS